MITASAGACAPRLCDVCGIPVDNLPFDERGVEDLAGRPLRRGETRTITRFLLPDRYCGVLEYFSQYSDAWARDRQYDTPGLVWSVRANGRPLHPFAAVRGILNPWGYGSFPTRVRLPGNVELDLVVRRIDELIRDPADPEERIEADPSDLGVIRGRIAGRYWYDEAHGARAIR